MLGGGTFTTQNKVLPGAYINFVSVARASATLSDRGICAIPMELNWGMDGEVFTVENSDFEKNSLKILGYSYDADEVLNIREVFKHARTLHVYRLNSGEKATNTYATAKYSGTRGNDIKIVIQANADDENQFDVITYLGASKVDTQTVSVSNELVANDYIMFKTGATLEATAGIALSGGTNLATLTGTQYQDALDKLESYSFNTLGCVSTTDTIKALFVAYTKRMRDEAGVKFQTVIYNYGADYEGVINVKNKITEAGMPEQNIVYWTVGAQAGCAVNKSNTNITYDGEYTVDVNYKQSELEAAILAGEFVFHKVGVEVRVLEDINSFVTFVSDKNSDFSLNQVIRILDQIGNDIAVLFNTRYLGKIQNNEAGRVSFWNDMVVYNKELETLNAIEGFESTDVTVKAGNDKRSVVVTNAVQPVAAMEKLYMTVMAS
ncbi:tail sheath protein [Lachnotalea glycerini]|uniref:Tail sheath protein n=2 Tax=Lachnotalea glycerini TaxID=1763509 RepID=A0A318EGK4_9FIRM|nr:phage tail sheath family protein [Lachnotalea glycerini]PXV85091.1 tail sheath protein [Lachnotalea glycerini]